MSTSTKVYTDQRGEFETIRLCSESVEVTMVPSLGAKIIGLLDRVGGREWTWSANPERRLRKNYVGDAFDDSPLIGVDECIPTVAPCEVGGEAWPDHGEVWSRAWDIERAALDIPKLVTTIRLETAPLTFRRTLSLEGQTLRFDYALSNESDEARPYAWALHPLLAMRDGDRIELPVGAYEGRIDSVANLPGLATGKQATWPRTPGGIAIDELLPNTENSSLKLYLPSPKSAEFAVTNASDGTSLRGCYGPVDLLPYLGIWVTRGGWNGYHHFAVEPTNVNDDRADRIEPKRNAAAVLGPGEHREWFVELVVGSGV